MREMKEVLLMNEVLALLYQRAKDSKDYPSFKEKAQPLLEQLLTDAAQFCLQEIKRRLNEELEEMADA